MTDIGKRAEEIRKMLNPMVALFVEQMEPRKDLVSLNQAYKVYGRPWVDRNIANGNLAVKPVSNRKFVSRAAMECLITAEMDTPKVIF